MSNKRKIEREEYLKLRMDFLKAHPICEVCGEHIAQDVHHKAKRGINLNNVSTWMSVCRACHYEIETHKGWAREIGYLV
jgi:hypothetical protein